MFVGTLGS